MTERRPEHSGARRARARAEQARWATTTALGICLAFVLVACSDDVAETSETAEVEQPAEAAPAPSDPVEMEDIRPPEFAGVQQVELLGLDLFRISWEPASDDKSDPSEIHYKIYHIVEPYEELTEETPSLFVTDPGATSATLAHDSAPGRFYVRAVDVAGNHSPPTSGLLQRRSRPLVRASDGTLAARITQCAQLEPGRALCVGEDGYIARWEFNHWEPLDLGGIVATLRIASTPSGLFVFTELGHLFGFDEEGEPRLVDVSFPRRQPELPFRQFTADHLGLQYWLDAEGRVYVGADREFVPMSRPLALPGEDCRRLQGLTFSATAAFAACLEGNAYSANPLNPRFTWLSLTPNADFQIDHGFRGVVAANDTEGLLYDETGIRRVGVGGWTPILLVDWHVPGVHPMDIPEDAPPIGYISQVFRRDGTLHAATDLGLLRYVEASWELTDNTDGALAGLVASGPHELNAHETLIYADGGVGSLGRRGRDWLVERDLTGFETAWRTFDDQTLAVLRDGEVFAWRDAWQEVADAMPDGTVSGVAGGVDDALFAYGADPQGVGAIWRLNDAAWRSADWLYEPASEREDEDDGADDGGFVFEDVLPPEPMTGVPAEDALPGVPSPALFRHLDIRPDGRALAVTADQVWWRMSDGWRLVHVSASPIHAGFVDAGETWVILTESGSRRCWRDQCGASVPQVTGGPSAVQSVIVDGGGWVIVDTDQRVHRFVPAQMPPGEPLVEPAFESPTGSWELVRTLGRRAGGLSSYEHTTAGEVLLTDAGELYERQEADWVLQAEGDDLIAVMPVGEAWGVLTPDGLFQLGTARAAIREVVPDEEEATDL